MTRTETTTPSDDALALWPPGESDGSSSAISNDEGKGFDRMCDPVHGGNALNGNCPSGALANASLSRRWFSPSSTSCRRTPIRRCPDGTRRGEDVHGVPRPRRVAGPSPRCRTRRRPESHNAR
ncbi:hypothetical protein GCM10023191_023280 [Actinoallomurus oryzae]|uniref:Uncharacterized protein n=1 Tax=Actinoallomurus oryzae TaxID=502180 RepID=A0ABP8PST2_9ACTN